MGSDERAVTDLGARDPRLQEAVLPAEHILQFFVWQHLPPALAVVSQPFAVLAHELVATLPRNPERTVALRKLLEARDAAVRARLAQ
jgi:hypothetical protein